MSWEGQPGDYEEALAVSDSDSLQSMDSAAKTTRGANIPLEPVLPCQQGKVWLELTVLDSSGEPVAQTECVLEIPEGKGLMQKTDDRGYVKFDGISADPQTFMLRLESSDSAQSGVRIRVLPRQQGTAAPAQSKAPQQDEVYFEVPWERDLLIASE